LIILVESKPEACLYMFTMTVRPSLF
jgi:hypothetical protein